MPMNDLMMIAYCIPISINTILSAKRDKMMISIITLASELLQHFQLELDRKLVDEAKFANLRVDIKFCWYA